MRRITAFLVFSLLLSGCGNAREQPLPTAERVELSRFMGDWYVIAAIPTFLERRAYDAKESYTMIDKGTVAATFSFRRGGFDGALKRYHLIGYVKDTHTNAVWEMQFMWPFKSDYRVMFLASDYSTAIVGRTQRDYVWIMARSPTISNREYLQLVHRIADAGYDTGKLQRMQQRLGDSKPL